MKVTDSNISARQIKIEGLVQGVGFRPFIYRIASRLHIKGYVFNKPDCVMIKTEGPLNALKKFEELILSEKPEAAVIKSITATDELPEGLKDFEIITSREGDEGISEISPDIATCHECLHDLKTQKHRINYPFINCTNCGPRFTIIRNYPYDRENTTMDVFDMCDQCRTEYNTISDRRFHAQPVACNHCGPFYTLCSDTVKITGFEVILDHIGNIIDNEGTIAVKSLGGYNLMCDALSEKAVDKIREIKKRDTKPFAVMFKDLETILRYCQVNQTEKKELESFRKPIVILSAGAHKLVPGVTSGFSTIGAFLPYLPLHYLLFEKIKTHALVLTSGNISDEPIVIKNKSALNTFGTLCDVVLTNNREIHNRIDDSVLKIIADKPSVFRRARGYVPTPVDLYKNCNGILATGAELVNAFCLGKGQQAVMSQYIGDLKNYETYEFFLESIATFKKLYRFTPGLLAADMHPDYLATRYADEQNLSVIKVQHHHAHIASCMAEHNLDEPVIGVSMDGTGLGTDNKIWGSEFMVADMKGFERLYHFEYIPVPGGDIAVKQPWRTALSYLYKYFGKDCMSMQIPFLKKTDPDITNQVIMAIDKHINCPESCSAGRLFDAVWVLISTNITSSFHAEAPMRLEDMAKIETNDHFDYSITNEIISFKPVFEQILNEQKNNVEPEMLASKFHNTVAMVISDTVKKISGNTGLKKVVLSGGTFQNKYLVEMLLNILKDDNFGVFVHRQVPCNDGGIALGQLAVALNRL